MAHVVTEETGDERKIRDMRAMAQDRVPVALARPRGYEEHKEATSFYLPHSRASRRPRLLRHHQTRKAQALTLNASVMVTLSRLLTPSLRATLAFGVGACASRV